MRADIATGIIDDIYEAAAIPERWPEILQRLSDSSATWGAALIAFDSQGRTRFTSTAEYAPYLGSFAASSAGYENRRPGRALASGHAGFLSDLDLFTQEELDDDPVYVDFLHPAGVRWTAGTVVPVPSSDVLVFDLARQAEQGPFERETMRYLDFYRPHLARAALMAHRLGLQVARSATEAMQTMGLPACSLTANGRVVVANALFEALSPRLSIGGYNRLGLASRYAQALLAETLAALGGGDQALGRSIAIPASEAAPALILHVLPVRRAAQDVFTQSAAMLVATPVVAPDAPLTELLHGLFDLTPAESRVARAIANGLSIDDISVLASTSRETIRTQLKAVMAKTGTRRQVDLVRLLAGARPMPAKLL